MEHADGVGSYQHIDCPDHLRTAVYELNALVADLDDSFSAESLDMDAAMVAGVHQVKALALRRLGAARRRLDWLCAADAVAEVAVLDRRPQLVSAWTSQGLTGRHGLEVVPVVTAGEAPCGGISSGAVWLPPRFAAQPHVHAGTDVIVVVAFGEAVTLWWDASAIMHAIVQRPGEHLFIPRGVPHCGFNPHAQTVIAHEFWSDPRFGADIQLRPELLPDVGRHWGNTVGGLAADADPAAVEVAELAGSRSC